MTGPSTTGSGVDEGLGSGEGVAVCVTVGIGIVEVGGIAVDVCVSLEKGNEIVVSIGVARAISVGTVETVCKVVAILVSAEGCVL